MQIFRKILSFVILGFLFMPLIQGRFHVAKVKPLSGAFVPVNDTAITLKGWFSGKYQAHKEQHLRDTFGFRELFIRIRNQLDYNFFNKANASDIVIGRNGELFNTWYIEAYKGTDFAGTKKINETLDKLKSVQDKLAKLNKTLLFVIAPSKDLYAPENIPDGTLKGDSINRMVFVRLAKDKGLNFIDFGTYFAGQKNKTPYLLFSKQGSHWSTYGACIAGDSIISMLEQLRKIKMLRPQWKDTIVKEEANGNELELEDEMNLLFSFNHRIMGHPHVKAFKDSTIKRPSLLFIGDSFFWGLASNFDIWNSYSTGNFCYYFKTVYTLGGGAIIPIGDFDLTSAIQKDDIIIVETAESNLREFDWGFSDAARNALKIDTITINILRKKVLAMRNSLKGNFEYLKIIADKATKKNIPVDSMLTLEAAWLVDHQKN